MFAFGRGKRNEFKKRAGAACGARQRNLLGVDTSPSFDFTLHATKGKERNNHHQKRRPENIHFVSFVHVVCGLRLTLMLALPPKPWISIRSAYTCAVLKASSCSSGASNV